MSTCSEPFAKRFTECKVDTLIILKEFWVTSKLQLFYPSFICISGSFPDETGYRVGCVKDYDVYLSKQVAGFIHVENTKVIRWIIYRAMYRGTYLGN